MPSEHKGGGSKRPRRCDGTLQQAVEFQSGTGTLLQLQGLECTEY